MRRAGQKQSPLLMFFPTAEVFSQHNLQGQAKCSRVHCITGADPGQDPTPKGGGGTPPPSTDPKMVVQKNGFCAGGARDFVLGIWQGKFFCSTLCVCTQNTQNFVENSKMAEKHKTGF